MGNNNSILHLICGLPGAWKTTLAKKIETELKAIRFSPDERIKEIWSIEENNYRDRIEQLQWKIGKKILASGTDITIERGTWGKDEREKLRDEAWAIGSKVKFYYLDVPKDILIQRILERNKNIWEYEFLIPEDTLHETLDEYIRQFQVPQEDELKTYDYLG